MIVFWIARLVLLAGAVALIVWGARRLDRYEAELEFQALVGDLEDWTHPPFRRPRDVRAFADQLEDIWALPEAPEVAA